MSPFLDLEGSESATTVVVVVVVVGAVVVTIFEKFRKKLGIN